MRKAYEKPQIYIKRFERRKSRTDGAAAFPCTGSGCPENDPFAAAVREAAEEYYCCGAELVSSGCLSAS